MEPSDPTLAPPPSRLVEAGAPVLGMFDGPVPDVDLERLRPWGPFSALRFKQWQHVAVVHPQLALTFAVVDVGYLKLGWVQAIDRRTGLVVQHERKSPFLDVRIARSLFDERTWLRAGAVRIELHNHLSAGEHRIRVRAPRIEADLVCRADTTTPLVVNLPLGRNRSMYSHKVPLPVQGRIRWSGHELELDPSVTTALFDIHKAHYPHHTWWRWGTFAGTDERGRRVAVNLTRNVVIDPAYHENCLWVDGRAQLLPAFSWEMDTEPWRAVGEGIDLRFHGHGERWENLDVGLVRSRFRQRYGVWEGTIAGHRVRDAWGLAEDHHSAW